ncbi:hypothetical protein COCNU_scaffold003949G000010 [Cocos nucifera]|nr:hypothetical protein [Cocos nucifera]
MDTKAVEMLTKGLYTKKRKGKASSDSSKRMKVGVSSFAIPTSIVVAPKVIASAEVALTTKDLRAEIYHLQERVVKVEHLAEEKATNIESFQGVLRKEEFISVGVKATLALEVERKKEVENKVAELEARMAKLVLEVMTQAVEEFTASFETRNLNVEFDQEAFIKDFELCKCRVARRFPELDLKFLEEEDDDVEAGPSYAIVDPSFVELAFGPSEPAIEAPEPVRALEAVKSALAPSSIIPFESPINIDPLPQGVLLKPLIKDLKKEIHLLKRKLKKTEDNLQASQMNASEATKEVTCLQNLHMKDSASFSIRKESFERKLAELRKNASDKSLVLMARIGSLETQLKAVKEKIQLLKESSSWSSDKA